MTSLNQEQVAALGRIQAEMAKLDRPWRIDIIGHNTESGVTIDLELMMPCDDFATLDDELEKWAKTVPGYEVDDIGHGLQPVDGLIWRSVHLIPTA